MHRRIAERIAHTARLAATDTVLEIGPGTGMLTKELLRCAQHVIALEADEVLYEDLEVLFATDIAEGRLDLRHQDVRTFSPTTLLENYHLVANIPYYLTGEIFRLFLETERQPQSMILLVQKEVAERIARSKKESILSLSVKVYGTPHYEFTVPRGAFRPAPNVDSAVLSIRDISRKNFTSSEEEKQFFHLLHTGFAHKRKILTKNLKSVTSAALTIPKNMRAEDMSLADWLMLMRLSQENQE